MIERLGMLLFLGGTALATSYATRTVSGEADKLSRWFDAAGVPFSVWLVVMVAGALLARKRPRRGDEQSESTRSPKATLSAIEAAFAKVRATDPGHRQELLGALDLIQEQLVPEFLEHKEALVADHGLLMFAQLMGPFASFERNLARAWSARVDDDVDEVRSALTQAAQALEHSLEQFRAGEKQA